MNFEKATFYDTCDTCKTAEIPSITSSAVDVIRTA